MLNKANRNQSQSAPRAIAGVRPGVLLRSIFNGLMSAVIAVVLVVVVLPTKPAAV